MTKNKLSDLNNHLFEQLERLNDEDLSDKALAVEIKRADAMTEIASTIIDNAELALKAQKYRVKQANEVNRDMTLPEMLEE